MEKIAQKLLNNSKSAQLACIEIHNKPIFPFRYEVCVILNINAWELLLKAFIISKHPEVKVINDDGTTKPFEECLAFVSSELGKDFTVARENIARLYDYRCNIIHFYQDDFEILLFALLSKNVILYHEFLINHFGIDIAEEVNLVLLPIGFKKPTSPLDYLSKKSAIQESSQAVQTFVKSISDSASVLTEEGLEDSILYSFKMSLINENRIKNADVVAAITKDASKAALNVENIIGKFSLVNDSNHEGVKKVVIDEHTLFSTVYTQTYDQVLKNCRKLFADFVQNAKFNNVMKGLKGNPMYHRSRYLDIKRQSGVQKDYYSEKVYDELATHYTKKEKAKDNDIQIVS